jgi:hypothetical protein
MALSGMKLILDNISHVKSPNHPVQIVRVHSKYFGRRRVITGSLFEGLKNRLFLNLTSGFLIL